MMELFQQTLVDEIIDEGAMLLRGFALKEDEVLLAAIETILARSPFRHLQTPGGKFMSVAMTNCGEAGWHSDRRGYRYTILDPLSGQKWPPMPECFSALAAQAAVKANFPPLAPDVCLINCYQPGASMSLHQDRDEGDFSQPIVSISLGLPAIFLWGGKARGDRPKRYELFHGDVVVWGGPSRLNYHGVMKLKPGQHGKLGEQRYNLTFRQAGTAKKNG